MTSKVALVTGGARGIGRAIVLRLAHDGFDMAINVRQEETGKPVAQEVRAMGRKALTIAGDVSKSVEVKAMFAKALREFGRLDVLVTNAGVIQINTLEELDEDIWDRTLAVNAKGTYLCILEATKPMIQQKSGRIITMGSGYAIEGAKDSVAYSASKFAVRGMTQAFAKALGPHGVTVNCIVPGYILTDMWAEADAALGRMYGYKPGEALEEEIKAHVPLQKPGLPEDVASAVSFLASEDARYITGATIQVGGGSPIF